MTLSEILFKSLLNKAYNSKHQNPFKDPGFNLFAREALRAYGYGLVEASKDIHVTSHPFDNEEEVKQFDELKKKI